MGLELFHLNRGTRALRESDIIRSASLCSSRIRSHECTFSKSVTDLLQRRSSIFEAVEVV